MTSPPRRFRLGRRLLRVVLPPTAADDFADDVEEELAHRTRTGGRRLRDAVWYWRQIISVDVWRLRRELAAPVEPRRRLPRLPTLWRDVRFSVRSLSRSWTFTGTAIFSLALGIGATTTIFGFVRPFVAGLPLIEAPDRLAVAWSMNPSRGTEKSVVSLADFADWREANGTFESLAASTPAEFNLSAGGEPMRVGASRVTTNYFETLGVTPALGRTFREDEEGPGSPLVVVLSHGVWERAFGADPAALGREVLLDGRAGTVIGVMPRRFVSISGDAWVPLSASLRTGDRGQRAAFVLGRLRDDVTVDQAGADLTTVAAAIERDHPATNAGWTVNVVPFEEEMLGAELQLVLVLLGLAAVLVLSIACVNVANLLLARSTERRSELAVRTAMGAGPGRLFGQLLTESATLGLAGGLAGLVVTVGGTRMLRWAFGGDATFVDRIGIDGPVLLFAIAVSVATGLVFGIVPAWRAIRPDVRSTLSEGGRGLEAGRSRLRPALVSAEVAFALVLLVVTGLLFRTVISLERVPTGFDVRNLVTMRVSLPEAGYAHAAQRVAFFNAALERVRNLPGIEGAGAASRLPMAGSRNNPIRSITIEGQPSVASDDAPWAIDLVVTPGYLSALGLPLVSGRDLDEADSADAQRVAVISETLAARHWGESTALGARLVIGEPGPDPAWITVVGVVGDVRNDDADQPPLPQIYLPLAQHPRSSMSLLARTTATPLDTVPAMREQVVALDRNQPVYDISTMEQVLYEDTAGSRIFVSVLGVFGTIALLLASVGIYGMVAHAAAQRRHEVGIRMALGAGRREVYRLIVWRGMVPVIAGLAVGIAASLLLAQVFTGLLYRVSPSDPVTFASVAAVLGLMALVASAVPAVRSARIDPLRSLRHE